MTRERIGIELTGQEKIENIRAHRLRYYHENKAKLLPDQRKHARLSRERKRAAKAKESPQKPTQ